MGDYQHLGILPDAMRNFLALLGWSPRDDREILSREELIQLFTLDAVLEKSAVFDTTKLEWMNGQYIQKTAPETLLALVQADLVTAGLDLPAIGRERLLRAVEIQRERARTTLEIAHRTAVRFDPRLVKLDEKSDRLIAKDPAEFREVLRAVHDKLAALSSGEWLPERLEVELRTIAEARGVGAGVVFQPVRVALTGTTVSEPVHLLLEVVGRDGSLARLTAAQAWATARA